MRCVQRRNDGLLDLGAGETVHLACKSLYVEVAQGLIAPGQVNRENRSANLQIRQIHEKYFVESALAHEFGRKLGNIVRGCDDEYNGDYNGDDDGGDQATPLRGRDFSRNRNGA